MAQPQPQPQPQETTPDVDAKEFYGYLFDENKSPTPVLNALLRGVANHIVRIVQTSAIDALSFMLIIVVDRECGK